MKQKTMENRPSIFVSGSGKSMMRWAVYVVIILTVFLGVSGVIVQFILAFNGNDVDWGGFSLFVASLTTLAGTGLTGKWLQKKEEVRYNSKHHREQNFEEET